MIQKVLQKMFGSKNERDLKRYQPIVEKVNALADTYAAMDDEGLRAQLLINLGAVPMGARFVGAHAFRRLGEMGGAGQRAACT